MKAGCGEDVPPPASMASGLPMKPTALQKVLLGLGNPEEERQLAKLRVRLARNIFRDYESSASFADAGDAVEEALETLKRKLGVAETWIEENFQKDDVYGYLRKMTERALVRDLKRKLRSLMPPPANDEAPPSFEINDSIHHLRERMMLAEAFHEKAATRVLYRLTGHYMVRSMLPEFSLRKERLNEYLGRKSGLQVAEGNAKTIKRRLTLSLEILHLVDGPFSVKQLLAEPMLLFDDPRPGHRASRATATESNDSENKKPDKKWTKVALRRQLMLLCVLRDHVLGIEADPESPSPVDALLSELGSGTFKKKDRKGLVGQALLAIALRQGPGWMELSGDKSPVARDSLAFGILGLRLIDRRDDWASVWADVTPSFHGVRPEWARALVDRLETTRAWAPDMLSDELEGEVHELRKQTKPIRVFYLCTLWYLVVILGLPPEEAAVRLLGSGSPASEVEEASRIGRELSITDSRIKTRLGDSFEKARIELHRSLGGQKRGESQ